MTAHDAHQPQQVPGPTPEARAINAAGALAELGATSLLLRTPDGRTQPLAARTTDLPATILSTPPGSTLESTDLRLTLTITPTALLLRAP